MCWHIYSDAWSGIYEGIVDRMVRLLKLKVAISLVLFYAFMLKTHMLKQTCYEGGHLNLFNKKYKHAALEGVDHIAAITSLCYIYPQLVL